ncbi:MAG: tetratricopeptide repeat protein [Terracidiphilus sp.]|jgi:tetratricopeptide (TPR) repeat protein
MFTIESTKVDRFLRHRPGAAISATELLPATRRAASLAWQRISAGVLFWLVAGSLAHSACTPPPALKARLASRPTAEAYSALGSWFGDRKQFDCAAQAFASAARMQPSSSSLQYMWGLSLFSAGHDAEAAAPLRQAVHLDPSDVRPHLVLGAALDRQKKIADAENQWRAALAIDPDSETALDNLSQDLIEQKDYPGVVALLDKPAGSRVRSPLQCLNLGLAYAGEVKLDDAVRVLREGLNTAPDSLPIADELAVVLMLLIRDQEAYGVFELALQKHPGDQTTQLLYLRALVSSHSLKAPQFALQLLKEYPDQWEVLYLNAVLEAGEGDSRQARVHLERSIAVNPDDAESQKLLGDVLVKLEDLPHAKEHLEKAIALGDTQPEVQYDLARVLQRLGDVEHARQRLQVYQQLKNAQTGRTQAAGKAEMGDQAMAAGNAAQAVVLYREALSTDPDEPILFYKLSQALEKTNDIAGEKAALQRAIQLNPRLAEAQNQMGYLAVRAGDTTQAESYFRAAIQASPSYVVAWVNLAATQASEARWKEAKQAVDRALEIDPDNPGARRLDQAIAAAHPSP